MKTCSKCKQSKEVSSFNKKKSSVDGIQTICKECNKNNLKKHYLQNKNFYLNRNLNARKEKRDFIDSIKNQLKCKVCGEKEICCLDFHHKEDGKKDFSIGNASNRNFSIQKIKDEIAKCVCVCGNCHRKIHAGIILCP